MNTNIIRDAKALDSAIASIARRGAKLDADVHVAGLSALYLAAESGNASRVLALAQALPGQARVKGFAVWVAAHSPVVLSFDKGKPAKVSVKKGWKLEDFDLDAADAVPFWEFTKEKDPTPVTVAKLVAYIKRLAESDDAEKVEPEAKALAAKLAAIAA